MSRRHEAAEEMNDFRMAYIISTIVNVNRGKKSKAATPFDFMPSKIKDKKQKKTQEELLFAWEKVMGPYIVDNGNKENT